MPIVFEYAHQSYVGKERVGAVNEDALGVFVADGEAPHGVQAIFCVADGMGGGDAGDVASKKVLADIIHSLAGGRLQAFARRRGIPIHMTPHLLKEAVVVANDKLSRFAAARGQRMGATLEALVVRRGRFYLAHAGDSRTYRIRRGVIEQLTADHSAVEELVRMNVPRSQATQLFGSNVVTNILGVQPAVRVDLAEGDIAPGDCFVLCTDGLTSHVRAQDIAAVVAAAPSPQEACDELVRTANERDGSDNITILLARAVETAAAPA